jgi:hypothetical protein
MTNGKIIEGDPFAFQGKYFTPEQARRIDSEVLDNLGGDPFRTSYQHLFDAYIYRAGRSLTEDESRVCLDFYKSIFALKALREEKLRFTPLNDYLKNSNVAYTEFTGGNQDIPAGKLHFKGDKPGLMISIDDLTIETFMKRARAYAQLLAKHLGVDEHGGSMEEITRMLGSMRTLPPTTGGLERDVDMSPTHSRAQEPKHWLSKLAVRAKRVIGGGTPDR